MPRPIFSPLFLFKEANRQETLKEDLTSSSCTLERHYKKSESRVVSSLSVTLITVPPLLIALVPRPAKNDQHPTRPLLTFLDVEGPFEPFLQSNTPPSTSPVEPFSSYHFALPTLTPSSGTFRPSTFFETESITSFTIPSRSSLRRPDFCANVLRLARENHPEVPEMELVFSEQVENRRKEDLEILGLQESEDLSIVVSQ